MFNLKIFHKGLILVSVPLIFEIAFVLLLVNLLHQAEAEADSEARAKDIVATVDLWRRNWTDAGLAVGFYKWTQNPLAEKRFRSLMRLIKKGAENATELAKGNPEEEKLMKTIQENVPLATRQMERAMEARGDEAFGAMFSAAPAAVRQDIGGETASAANNNDSQQQDESLSRNGDENGQSDRDSWRHHRHHQRHLRASREPDLSANPMVVMRKAADRLVEIETKVAEKSPLEKARTRRLIQQALFGGLTMNVVLTVLLTFYLSRSITSRLACVTDNTLKLAKRQKLNTRVGGEDEIALLDNCLHVTADELTELENFKRDMMSMVSHELRSPLSSVLMILKLLSEGALGQLPEKALARIKTAESNADRLIRLINDLLDIDRMQAGKLEMSFKEVLVEQVLDQSLDYVKELAQKNKISILKEGSTSTLLADHERLVQVVINLLSNAIKYSPPQGTIRLVAIDSAEWLEVQVIDQGRGIPAGFSEKVFEKFQQVDQSDAREKKGSGLGLAICKAIVEQHNGKIGVESEEGKGSKFWFRIPKTLSLSEVESEDSQNAEKVSPAESR